MQLCKKLSVLAISLALCSPAWASDKDQDPSAAELAKEVMAGFYPPSITELFDNAQKNGLTEGWDKKIRIHAQDFSSMSTPTKAFNVGTVLADVAFLVLTKGKDAAPDKSLIEYAYTAINAINPPTQVQAELQKLRTDFESGVLKDQKLRKAVDQLINETVPLITDSEQAEQRDVGELVMAAGYFKALYMGASTLASLSEPSQEQLEIMVGWKDITLHTLDYIAKQASPDFKQSLEVKDLVRALVTIKPLVSKSRDQISKADAEQIAAALKPLFS